MRCFAGRELSRLARILLHANWENVTKNMIIQEVAPSSHGGDRGSINIWFSGPGIIKLCPSDGDKDILVD